MAEHNHEVLRRLFDLAIAAPADQRAALLDRECRGDAALKQRIEAMIAASEDDQFLAAPTANLVAPSADAAPTVAPSRQSSAAVLGRREGDADRVSSTERPGGWIGPYRLLQLIGEGGFGTVFMAEQEKPVARKVALKIIKMGMDTRQVVARFEQERQALAMMDHPNIARVVDAGATETGRPYFVMDLVKGDPIGEYCDKHNLSIEDRLDLFAQVCNAVQHAHTKGIIHRDIKPSNILVSTQDGRPNAKVIDFGIAKATASKLTEKTLFTEHRQLIGTPEYMSPEQAEGSLDIDTRTDVYSLGVLLYELLTGSTPFSGTSLRSAAYAEIQRIIREVDPPRPSTRLSQNTETIASVAASRQTEPRRLGTLIRGELDWIVMKALEKDRARRYETANGLAMDIKRYLAGEAVVAAPPSRSYRLQKFVRRNKGAVTAAAAIGAALLIGVVAFAWQATVARQQRDQAIVARKAEAEQRVLADQQRDRAVAAEVESKKRADELKQVSDFQSSMLSQIDPAGAGIRFMEDLRAKYAAAIEKAGGVGGGGVPEAERPARSEAFARELARVNATDAATELIDGTILKPAIGAVDTKFKDQPIVDASLRQTLAELYRTLGRYDEALPLQKQALATRKRTLGADHPDTLESLATTGKLVHAQGHLAEAEPYLRESLEGRRRTLGEDSLETLTSLNLLGRLFQSQGKFAEAEPLYQEAMQKSRTLLGSDHPDTLHFIADVGLIMEAQGKGSDAEPLLRESMDGSRRVQGEDHPDTLRAINNLGYLLSVLGRYAESERFLRQAMEKSRRIHGEFHPDTLIAINNVASCLEKQGKPSEAEELYRETLSKCRRVLGDDHVDTLRAVNNLANVLRSEGRLAEAEPFAREAMDSYRRTLGDKCRETLIAINVYGYLLIQQGKPAEAEVYWREAYTKGREALGEDHPDVLVWTQNLGGLLRSQGKLDEAEPYLREAVEKSRRVNGNDHPGTTYILRSMALLLDARGGDKAAEAEPLYREVLETRRRVLGPDHPDTLMAMTDLAISLRNRGRLTDAEALFREALAGYERTRATDAWVYASNKLGLGRVLIGQERFAEAETELLEAERIFAVAKNVPAGRYNGSVEGLVKLYEAWDKAEPGKHHDAAAAKWTAKLEPKKPAAGSTPVEGKKSRH